MQGLVNFAAQCALIFSVLLPTFLYLSALGLFLFSIWGLWMQAQPRNPFAGKPWVPWISLITAGMFASFPTILNKVNISAGSTVTTSVVAGLTTYSPPNTSNILGDTPGDTVLNIVTAFQGFFQAFGAMCVFFAMLAWHAIVAGRSNRAQSSCAIQFVFGVMLLNVLTISQWLVAVFTT